MLGEYEFALCLTHDVDRTREGLRGLYYGARDRDISRFASVLPGRNTYWQFDTIMNLEASLGVRSAFYFLVEKDLFTDFPVREWLRPNNWVLYRGRYDVNSDAVADTVRQLDDGGWEVGVHGSYRSFADLKRFRYEKSVVEAIVGHEIVGGRQHYLNLSIPETWQHHAEVGLRYDTTLGSSTGYGFDHGYGLVRPFDGFVVFPLTLMDITLPNVSNDYDHAWRECERLLEEARENDAVMTVDWHQRCFSDIAFPRYGELYRRIIERALEMGAWVGPPGELYRTLSDDPELLDALTSPVGPAVSPDIPPRS
ncbi:polysaccharide deacetylase family protein [Halomarina rubra]|uniref:Polysaccharide deacetylase family protein n=1 Tax=Halomarina rubra TaxID=2071873 RepID=A0ABD6AY23_9EURY|nr:polysaccharide deacetylase family protein [Halomarina rubra]